MEARRGRDLRSEARCAARQRGPAISGRGRSGFNVEGTTGSGRAHARHRESGVGAFWPRRRSWGGGLQGRQAKRGGEVPKALPLECKHSAQRRRREGMATGAAEKRRVARRTTRRMVPRSQFAASATIDCKRSMTPGSTNTQAWSSAIGTLNTRVNTVRRR